MSDKLFDLRIDYLDKFVNGKNTRYGTPDPMLGLSEQEEIDLLELCLKTGKPWTEYKKPYDYKKGVLY